MLPSSLYKGINRVLRAAPLQPHLNLIISQRPQLQIPSRWGLVLQHIGVLLVGRWNIPSITYFKMTSWDSGLVNGIPELLNIKEGELRELQGAGAGGRRTDPLPQAWWGKFLLEAGGHAWMWGPEAKATGNAPWFTHGALRIWTQAFCAHSHTTVGPDELISFTSLSALSFDYFWLHKCYVLSSRNTDKQRRKKNRENPS